MAKNTKTNRAYSVDNVLTKKFNYLELSDQWKNTIGSPEKAFSAIIWGGTSNGKTEAALQLAKELSNFGIVEYDSLEQGLSATMKASFERIDLVNTKYPFRLLDRLPFDELLQRMKRPKSADFLFIDSVQYTRITKAQYYELKELMLKKKKGIIWISQAKGKEPKGSLADDIKYDVDLKLRVEGFRLLPDGRLNGGGEPYVIWAEGAAKYWNEII